jgi:nucleolar protein 15
LINFVGAAEASPKPKKQKKSDDTVASKKAKAVKAAEEPAAKYKAVDTPMNDAPASEKKSKKKGKAPESAVEPVVEKPKKSAKASAAKEEAPKEQATKSRKDKAKDTATSEETSAVSESKKSKKSKKNKAQEEAKEPSPEVPADEQDGETDEDDDVDDQTAALLAGFESDRDESDAEKEDQGLTDADLEGKVPTGIMKKLKDVSHNEQKPGVIFVGYAERSSATYQHANKLQSYSSRFLRKADEVLLLSIRKSHPPPRFPQQKDRRSQALRFCRICLF